MVQTAEPWHRNHPAVWACNSNDLASHPGLLVQPEMRPVIVVVADALGHRAPEMPLVEHDDVIEQVSAAVADEAFGDSVLRWTAEAGAHRLDPEALDGADDLSVEVGRAIEDQILRSRAVRKRLA